MKDVVSHLLESGMDIGTRSSLKLVLMRLGYDVNLVDQIYIKIKNDAHKEQFDKTEFRDRAIFFPQCLRNSKGCKAELTDEGYVCARCGGCEIRKYKDEADRLGYGGFYIVPGGSMVYKLMRKRPYKAVIGVACFFELADAVEKCSLFRIPSMGVPLLRDGCKDTISDSDEVIATMRRKK